MLEFKANFLDRMDYAAYLTLEASDAGFTSLLDFGRASCSAFFLSMDVFVSMDDRPAANALHFCAKRTCPLPPRAPLS